MWNRASIWVRQNRRLLLAIPLLAIHLALVLDGARQHAPAFDEPSYISRGYVTLTTGDQSKTPEHPPTMMLLLGASLMGSGIDAPHVPGFENLDGFHFGQNFVYLNGALPPMALLFRARMVVALLSVVAGIVLFRICLGLGGDLAAFVALTIYALDPLVIAHAGLATLDLGASTFTLLAAVGLPWALGRAGGRLVVLGAVIAQGAILGLALTTKFSTLPLLVGIAATVGVCLYNRQFTSRRSLMWRTFGILCAAAGVVVLVSQPLGPRTLLTAFRLQWEHASVGHPAFAFGHYGKSGWWWYYPAAWLTKTPLPILLLTLLGIPALLLAWRRQPVLLTSLIVPSVCLAVIAVFSSVAIGVRNLLPITPVLALGGGLAAATIWSRFSRVRWGLPVLLVWLLVDTLYVHPFELSFINEAAGGTKAGSSLLADSNVDWGLDLDKVGAIVNRNPLRRLYLVYFGSAVPAAHGLGRYRWMPSFNLAPRMQQDGGDSRGREWIAISSTSLTGVYPPGRQAYAWLRARTPTAWAGKSILLFDITDDNQAHFQMGQAALNSGYVPGARAAFSRAIELAPSQRDAWQGLILTETRAGDGEAVRSVCGDAQMIHPSLAEFEPCRATETH
jgi:4-amino-4-deoxy-L-arabinose transferase-like glycosyltransferase